MWFESHSLHYTNLCTDGALKGGVWWPQTSTIFMVTSHFSYEISLTSQILYWALTYFVFFVLCVSLANYLQQLQSGVLSSLLYFHSKGYPSGGRYGGNWLFFVREFVKMKKIVREFVKTMSFVIREKGKYRLGILVIWIICSWIRELWYIRDSWFSLND